MGDKSRPDAQVVQQHKSARFDEAERCFRLGNSFAAQGRMDQAVIHYERALSLKPDAQVYNNLGNAYAVQGLRDLAVAQYERAISLRPAYPDAHNNLALVLTAQGKMDQAAIHYDRAVSLKPDFAEAHNNLALVLTAQGKIGEAIAHYKRALSLKPDYIDANSNLLLTLNYAPDIDPVDVYAAHLSFAKRLEAQVAAWIQPHSIDRSAQRRLRIGYVSSDFRQHSVACFIEPVLENHHHNQFEIFGYSNSSQEDAVTARLKSYADHWRNIALLSDEAVAQQIRNDKIDILVDLNGYTALNRVSVFARKPAPVQVSWLGYPNTTGLSAMEYRLTDGFADPVGMTEHLYSEKLMRLPECFSCYKPPLDAPEVSETPAQKKKYVTFGSFNHHAKITPPVMAIWARILQAVPRSRLTIKNFGLGAKTVQHEVHSMFRGLGIAPERLELLGHDRSQNDHLARYRDIDIALDPFPYNGATTTCEALWMGVPVITLAGKTHAGRVGMSQMSNLRLTDLISRTPEEYIATAIQLASDLERLNMLRKELRSRLASSPLTDARRFTKNLEQAYLVMWKNYIGAGA